MIIRNKFKYALILLAAVASMANAADVTINISGKITDSPCAVDSSGGANPSINLGNNIASTTLASAGKGSDWVPFSIKLINCPPSKNNIIATFTGTSNSYDAGSVYASTGDAKNVGVQFTDADGGGLGNNRSMTVAKAADNSATFNLKTRALATGVATGGTVSAIVFATFTYN